MPDIPNVPGCECDRDDDTNDDGPICLCEPRDCDGLSFCPTGYAQRYHAIGECDCPTGHTDPTQVERHEWSSSQPILTHCIHGVDLRLTPRCYLCTPWPDDSPAWKVTSPGHVHDGEWCAKCVEHGQTDGDCGHGDIVTVAEEECERLDDLAKDLAEIIEGHEAEIARLRKIAEAARRLLRRTDDLEVRWVEGRAYVRVPNDWIDDLDAVLYSTGEEAESVKNDSPADHARLRKIEEAAR